MIESFKIIAKELKRGVRLTVYLPLDYNKTNKKYDVIYMLDGQNLFSGIYNHNNNINLNDLFDELNLDRIVVAIHSPENPKWRLSELVPFDLGEGYENTLCEGFKDYILNSLIPLLKEKYRMNSFPSLFGFEESSVLALTLIDKFKYIALFSPKLLGFDNELLEYIKNIKEKNIYLYCGNDDDNIINSTLSISRILDSNKNINFYLDFIDSSSNIKEDWKDYIVKAVNYFQE